MVDNTKKMETENIVSVELSLINPQNIGFPVASKEELTSLNFDINPDGEIVKMDQTRDVSNYLMKIMGKKGLWKSFFNKKTEEFCSIKKPGSFVNFAIVVKIKNSSDLFSDIAFGMSPDEFIEKHKESGMVVSEKFKKLAKDIHGYLCGIYGSESMFLFRAVMDKSTPRFFCLIVPMKDNEVIPYKDIGYVKEQKPMAKAAMQNEITKLVCSYI